VAGCNPPRNIDSQSRQPWQYFGKEYSLRGDTTARTTSQMANYSTWAAGLSISTVNGKIEQRVLRRYLFPRQPRYLISATKKWSFAARLPGISCLANTAACLRLPIYDDKGSTSYEALVIVMFRSGNNIVSTCLLFRLVICRYLGRYALRFGVGIVMPVGWPMGY
jgi:hypothetical protein